MNMTPQTLENMTAALDAIARAEGEELTALITALCEAMERWHPNNEAVFLTLPTDDPAERSRVLEQFHQIMLRHHKQDEKDSLG